MQFFPGAGARKAAPLLFLALGAAASLIAGCGPKPVASVNGTNLSEKQFAELTETASAAELQGQQATVGFLTLFRWIQSQLMIQHAKTLNVYPSQQELDRWVDNARRRFEFQGSSLDEQLRSQGLTLKTFRERQLEVLVSENVLFRGITPSESDVQKTYETQKANFSLPATVKIAQITTKTEADAKKALNDINGGAAFEVVAHTYSQDVLKDQGGQVPVPLTRQAQQGAPWDQKELDAAFKLKPGQVSEPIKISEGRWIVVKLNEKTEAKEPKLEDVREIVRSYARKMKAQTSTMQMRQNQQDFLKFVQSAKLRVYRPEYKGVEQQFAQAMSAGPSGGAPTGSGGPVGPGGAAPGGGAGGPGGAPGG